MHLLPTNYQKSQFCHSILTVWIARQSTSWNYLKSTWITWRPSILNFRCRNSISIWLCFFPKRSGGCAPEAFVVAKQPSAALSVTRRKFRHMTCGALAAFWKVEMFLSRCGADAPGKNERVAPRLRRFHYERAYRASTFEITNLSAQKTRYVSGPLKRLSCPSASFLLFLAPVSSSAHYLLQFFHGAIFFYSVTNVF